MLVAGGGDVDDYVSVELGRGTLLGGHGGRVRGWVVPGRDSRWLARIGCRIGSGQTKTTKACVRNIWLAVCVGGCAEATEARPEA